ncbi:alpha-hydroxy acid oxidase [Candidatus Sororendozoicomonas aggregata]|uniref:alpha-hydroxy acid oxidase n=1 Tax=Candidatus Sororendozoicomonas aggregata TaxID=3073239 RepID=UPI002ECFDC9D
MTAICEIKELRQRAKKRVPRMFYDYADSGAWTESTYHANEAAFGKILLRQRVGVDISERSAATEMLGKAVTMPVALAPVGMAGMQQADGEIKAARAAEAFGVPFTLSTLSICSIEDVAEHTTEPFWFQLYMMRDREFCGQLIDRAKQAGCSALVLTLDLQLLGQRHKDIHNGLGVPPKLGLKSFLQLASRPLWCLKMATTKRRTFGNIVGYAKGVDNLTSLAQWTASQFDQTLSWQDVDWIRQRWGGKLIIKGIMEPDDAKMAVKVGADALVVSNHGGRQLDGAPSSIRALPAIVDAVGQEVEVHFDGGIRSGQDVMKALCLGASATYIGRAYIYGLGAAGEHGVTLALDIIKKELETTMGLCGETKVAQLGTHNLYSD